MKTVLILTGLLIVAIVAGISTLWLNDPSIDGRNEVVRAISIWAVLVGSVTMIRGELMSSPRWFPVYLGLATALVGAIGAVGWLSTSTAPASWMLALPAVMATLCAVTLASTGEAQNRDFTTTTCKS